MTTTAILPAGCAFAPPTETPLPQIRFVDNNKQSSALIIMLPGRGDRAETFVAEGFQHQGQQFGFDTIMVDAHFGYYKERSLIPRLHQDIVLPAKAAGYQEIWMLGVSMGGFGSVLYASNHPEELDGVILLAPYLGDRNVIDEIEESGGLESWNPAESNLKDYEIAAWSWLRDSTSNDSHSQVVLGYGLSDRLASAYPVLLERLDAQQIYTVEGGHGWRSWITLWNEISAELDFQPDPQ
ncbi:MAG TPA: alpha/beta fold hydrolase [Xanthomonadales bacterium]|nr:alpha/beta fold hydrolase [Xanthomonadales bacterium]